MATLVDSYSESNVNSNYFLAAGDRIVVGQSFTATEANILSVKFYLKKLGTPTGNITALLYAHTGTYGTSSIPTGVALATSDNVDVTTISTVTQSLVEFTFSGANQYAMVNGTNYCIECAFSGGGYAPDNGVYIGIDIASSTHGGNASYYDTAWRVAATYDTCFYVYGSGGGTPVLTHHLGLLGVGV